MTNDKPREWWINIFSGVVFKSEPSLALKMDKEIIHVIEYAKAQEIMAHDKECIHRLERDWAKEIEKCGLAVAERNELLQQRKDLLEEVERLKSLIPCQDLSHDPKSNSSRVYDECPTCGVCLL